MKKLITTWVIAMAQEWAAAGDIRTVWNVRVSAAIIAAEARGEGLRGMVAVAEVIRNRKGVIDIPEWSSLKNTTFMDLISRMIKEEGWLEALAIATRLHQKKLGTNITKGANHFHRVGKRPYWAKGKKGIIIGRHVFYKL